ncbi:MAG: uroporphyrinogen-III synthase [Devosia sp.]|nr:uroporphyrinogen-III synthase [Devosia sp.]
MARLLVTRAEPDAHETLARLAALGIEGVVAPLLEYAPLHTGLPDAAGFAAVALTSANALRALEERQALAPFRRLKLFAVGDRTAEAARAYGFTDVVCSGGTLRQLVEEIAAAGLAGPVFYPTARHQSGDLAQELAPAGIMVVGARVYEMRAAAALPPDVLSDLGANRFDGVLFYSRRTAETFIGLTRTLDRPHRSRLGVLCLSEQVAEPLVEAHFVRVGLAEHPSEEAMMTLALSFARDQNAS